MSNKSILKCLPTCNKGKSGFTLLETLFALLVLLIGFMAALSLNTNALRSGTLNENQFTAVFLADSKLEELKTNMPIFTGDSYTSTDYFDRSGLKTEDQNRALFTRTTTVNRETPSAKTDEIRVNVAMKRSPLAISYVTLLDHMDAFIFGILVTRGGNRQI
jgi:prepilin-type N-terminal cleavage/methylation domain-containing protein